MKTMLKKISTGHTQDREGASCGGKHTPKLRTLPPQEEREREGVFIRKEMHAKTV